MSKRGKRKEPRKQEPTDRVGIHLVLLMTAFLVPNLVSLFGGFLLDDLPVIVSNDLLHSLGSVPEIWTSQYWPDRYGLTLYRPVTRTIWAMLWVAGRGTPWVFHLANLAVGCAVVVLLYFTLLRAGVKERVSFLAAFLFALFPIHVEATTSIIGLSELLAGAFGLGALLGFLKGRRALALILFALAVLSKESAAALPALAWLVAPKPRRRYWPDALVAGGIIGFVLFARNAVALPGAGTIPPVDNPTALLSGFQRVLTALWVQCLYLWKTIVPLHLSADYSYKQIPLVMGLPDARAWAGLLLVAGSIVLLRRKDLVSAGVVVWWVLFLPGSNLLFPIGTLMGERLAYLPSAGLAMILAVLLHERFKKRRNVLVAALVVVALLYGSRTVVRNLDWLGPNRFYPKLVETSPESAKSWYFHGTWRAWKGDDEGAVASYDRSIEILPFYTEALHNRGNALVRLGRLEEAAASYQQVLRYDPGHRGAAINLSMLQRGVRLEPSRPQL